MTMNDDIATVKNFLDFNSPIAVANAWKRVVEALPVQTALEQFQEFLVGMAFTTPNSDVFTFVKTGMNSVTRIHMATGTVSYITDVESAFGWSSPNMDALILAEKY